MARGREQFDKYRFLISALIRAYSLFPKKFQKYLLTRYRKTTGLKGMAVRYALVKNLAKSVGEKVSIQPDVYFFNLENLTIGSNVSLHPMCYIEAYGGVSIGDNVSIAHGVTIMSVSHNYTGRDVPIRDQGISAEPIKISDNVWIGAKATILGNVSIGSGVVIGATAVVTKDIPDDCVAAGVPARIIKERIS